MQDLPDDRKPKFRARKSVVTDHRLREIQAFNGNPIPHSDYFLILEDFINMSIRRHGRPYPMIRLQGELLQELMGVEETVSEYKKKLGELEANDAPTGDLEYVKGELFRYKRLKRALRDIGDGIAWRLLDFDRCALTLLGTRARKQHINRDGVGSELHELGEIVNKNNEVALLNDLTHFLKKGDITAKLPDGSFEIVEVKSSKTKSNRLVKQKNDLEATLSFLNDGQKEDGGELIKIANLPLVPISYMRGFETILARAERECMVVEKIGDHLILHVTDFTVAKLRVDPGPFFNKLRVVEERWREGGDFVLDSSSLDKYVNVQNFAPFSIFPISYGLRVKLMTGAILVNSYFNISSVLRYLNTKGWTTVKGPFQIAAEYEEGNERELPIAVLKKGPLTVHLPMQTMARLAHEYLSVKTLADSLDGMLKAGRNAADGVHFNFDGECEQWH